MAEAHGDGEAEKELKDKVTKLVDSKFGGDWDKAFAHYAAKSGAGAEVERDDLLLMLEDADIGSWLTRGAWADGIMEEVDVSKDKRISREELARILRDGA
jgi:hypothetical protein